MTTPATHSFSLARLTIIIALAAGAIALAHLADRAILTGIHNPNAADADWGRMLRIAGYLPTWLLVAAAFALIDLRQSTFTPPLRDRWSRAALLTFSAALAGVLAEAFKLLIRRERPSLDDLGGATYVFRPFTDSPWSTSGLGMPSSHVAVAFGAAAILWRLYPRAWPVWLAFAAGCAATRILSRAHFLSDTVAGALVGIAAAAIVWTLHKRHLRAPEAAR